MNNEFTSFIFVYSTNESDLDMYDNDMLKINRYNAHTLQLYRGLISQFSYDRKYSGYNMPDENQSAKIFRITNKIESNVIIGSGADIQSALQRISDGISRKITRDMYISIYLMGSISLIPQVVEIPAQTTQPLGFSGGALIISDGSFDGSNGSSGSSGTSGSSGRDGRDAIGGGEMYPPTNNMCSSGSSGSSGADGISGGSGSSGSSGVGSSGSSGSSGGAGVSGSSGSSGANGTGVVSSLTSGHIFVGGPSNTPVDVPVSGDITISNSGVATVGSNVITYDKLDVGGELAIITAFLKLTGN